MLPQPIRDNVLVKPFEADSISEGGIIVPDNCKKTSNKVLVVAVGNGTAKGKIKLKVGDVGFRIKDCGDEIIYEGEKYFLTKATYILATLN